PIENVGSVITGGLPRGAGLEKHDHDHDHAAQDHQTAQQLPLEGVRLDDDLDHRRAEHQDVAEPEQTHARRHALVLLAPPGAPADCPTGFGYQEIVTPIIEHEELIERVGEDTDAVSKELYRFEDRGGRKIALRPEATAGIVRAYFEGGLNQGPQPARLYLFGPMFRYDRPQKGRYRQFYQFDIEAIGSGSAALDAEVIEIAQGWLLEAGISALRLELNSIGDGKCRPAYLERLKAYYRPLKSQLHGDCQLRLERNPLRLLDCKVPQCQPFKADAPRITDHLCDECTAHWAVVRRLLEGAGIEYQHNPYLVRGLDYYPRP